MRIGDMAKAAGVSTSAIRYYERRGVLSPPRRVNGVRVYDNRDLDRLLLATYYRSCGVPINALASFFNAKGESRFSGAHAAIEHRIAELDDVVRKARSMQRRLRRLLRCGCRGDRQRCIAIANNTRRVVLPEPALRGDPLSG